MKKLLIGMLIAMTVLVMSVGTVFAQDAEPTTISGTIQSVTTETDTATGDTTVLVTLVDELGASQTVRISLETADSLGLLVEDDGDPLTPRTVKDPADLPSGTIDVTGEVVADEGDGEEEAQHPVGAALAYFFGEVLKMDGIDYDAIMSYRNGEDGNAGFGVIAQALWMTSKLEGGDSNLFNEIMDAKLNNDYEFDVVLSDGTTHTIEADNWGQFRKEIKEITSEDKKDSLGDVMSDKDNKEGAGEDNEDTGEANLLSADDDGNGKGSSDNASSNKDNTNSKKDKGKSNKGRGHNK